MNTNKALEYVYFSRILGTARGVSNLSLYLIKYKKKRKRTLNNNTQHIYINKYIETANLFFQQNIYVNK